VGSMWCLKQAHIWIYQALFSLRMSAGMRKHPTNMDKRGFQEEGSYLQTYQKVIFLTKE